MLKTKVAQLLQNIKVLLCTLACQHQWGEPECTVFTQTRYIRKPECTVSPSYTEILDEKQIIYVENVHYCKWCGHRKAGGFVVNRVKEADLCELLIVATKRSTPIKKDLPCH